MTARSTRQHEWRSTSRPRPGAVGWLVAAVVFAGFAVGCSGTKYADKREEVVDVPESYAHAEVEGKSLDAWCSDFGAERLEELVDRAYEDNLQLRQSWARLKQAEARVRQAGAARWPNVDAEASFSRTEQPTLPEGIDIDNNNFKLSVGAGYEVDLWGRLANRQRAAQFERRAARADVEAMAMTLTSRIAEAWFNVVYQRARADLLEDQIEVAENFLELTLVRLSRGRSTALDVSQQKQQIDSLEGQLAQVEEARQLAENQLAVLVGSPPEREVAGERAELPELPSRPDAGIPADALKQRPDVRAALWRLEAEDERIAAAVKNQYPSIRLSISSFLQAGTVQELFEDIFWTAAASASQTLFDGGRKFAEVDAAEAAGESSLYNYGQTVLEALREVEDGLVREQQQSEYIGRVEEQLASARQSLRSAKKRYQQGATSYLRVLDALRSVQSLEQSLLAAKRQQLSNRVQLCRALGGDWSRELESPIDESNDDG